MPKNFSSASSVVSLTFWVQNESSISEHGKEEFYQHKKKLFGCKVMDEKLKIFFRFIDIQRLWPVLNSRTQASKIYLFPYGYSFQIKKAGYEEITRKLWKLEGKFWNVLCTFGIVA